MAASLLTIASPNRLTTPDRAFNCPLSPPREPLLSDKLFADFFADCTSHTLAEIESGISQENCRNEFKMISKCTDEVMSHAEKIGRHSRYAMCDALHYRAFNRYSNVHPYDRNRVRLGGEFDYINASQIELAGKRYIACQAPIRARTEAQFWNMVWEQESNVIVMLTRFFENSRVKAELYWPDIPTLGMTLGNYQIKLKPEEVIGQDPSLTDTEAPATSDADEQAFLSALDEPQGNLTKRVIEIYNRVSEERREITHFHFTGWPDHGTSTPEEFHELLNVVAKEHTSGPLIVHCSAGLGRAGTFIATDSLSHEIAKIKKGEREDKISVMQRVMELRDQRHNSVQSADQYELIYRTLEHGLKTTE